MNYPQFFATVNELVLNARRYALRKFLVAISAACLSFLAYSAVYAYRKPFTVARFDDIHVAGISYQTALIIAQVFGYMLSKFAGIRLIAELRQLGRMNAALTLMGIAWLSLLGFALTPAPYGLIWLFVNGFVLGFLWGIIFSYVEGRQATDFIGAAMATSFVFAGGFTRSVGKWLLLEQGVAEQWMPFVTGLLFALPMALLLWLLEKLPPPDSADQKTRSQRIPMNREMRRRFLSAFGPGVIAVTATYLLLTIMRDLRDNYMSNIWAELGYSGNFSVYTQTETRTSLILLVVMSMVVMIRRNIVALNLIHFLVAAGLLLAGIASYLFSAGLINGIWWMQLTGLGLYLGYIPFNCIFFERLVAAFRVSGNVGFLMYFADAFGYLGSVGVMLIHEMFRFDAVWSGFYSQLVILTSILGLAGLVYSLQYFRKKYLVTNFHSI